jgi:hypothetical protein
MGTYREPTFLPTPGESRLDPEFRAYCQGNFGLEVVGETPPPPPPPPPHPGSASNSKNAAARGTIMDFRRLSPIGFRRPRTHTIVTRVNANAIRPLTPGDGCGAGGTGRERGALTEAAVVVTVTVTAVAELPAVTGFGETVQVAAEGAPVQVNVTVPDNPPSPPTLKV